MRCEHENLKNACGLCARLSLKFTRKAYDIRKGRHLHAEAGMQAAIDEATALARTVEGLHARVLLSGRVMQEQKAEIEALEERCEGQQDRISGYIRELIGLDNANAHRDAQAVTLGEQRLKIERYKRAAQDNTEEIDRLRAIIRAKDERQADDAAHSGKQVDEIVRLKAIIRGTNRAAVVVVPSGRHCSDCGDDVSPEGYCDWCGR